MAQRKNVPVVSKDREEGGNRERDQVHICTADAAEVCFYNNLIIVYYFRVGPVLPVFNQGILFKLLSLFI